MNGIEVANKLFAFGTILAQVFLVLAIIYLLFFKKKYPRLQAVFSKHGMLLAFLTALFSMVASLFYSGFVGFRPCDLCWYQRIFMYPLVFLLPWALIKKDRRFAPYGLVLAVPGFLISLYHNYISYGGVSSFCEILGGSVSCTKRYVFELGYITIPMMALTAFALVILFLLFAKGQQSQR